MTALHNSSRIGADRGESGSSRPARIDLEELCRRALRNGWAAVRRAAAAVRWYMSQLMGDSAYATYLAHQRRTHPDADPLTERQFWRQKMDDQDRNPGARCC